MIGDSPKHEWDDKMVRVGEIESTKRGGREYVLYGLKGATNAEKRDFEKVMNQDFLPLAKFYVPSMKEPYYTWFGEIIERDELSGRELPLVNL